MTTLDARFELDAGLEGLGDLEAWRARDAQVRGRPVLVVRLAEGAAPRDEALRRAKALRHGAVLALLHHGVDGGRPYLVYEPFDGETLEARLARAARGDAALPRAEVERAAARLCEALEAAHAGDRPTVHGGLDATRALVRDGAQGLELRVFGFGLGREGAGVEDDLAALGRTLRALFAAPACRRDGGVAAGLDWRRDDLPDAAWAVCVRAMGGADEAPYADATAVLEALDAAWREPVTGPAPRPTAPVGLPPTREAPPAPAPAPAAEPPSPPSSPSPPVEDTAPPAAHTAPARDETSPPPPPRLEAPASPPDEVRGYPVALAVAAGVLLAVATALATRALLV